MDKRRLASQLIRHVRGRRSQQGFSKRLGYRTNVVHAWEAGRSFPTAAIWFSLLRRSGVDPAAAVRPFYGNPPEFLATLDLSDPEGVRRLLEHLRGQQSLTAIATRMGRNRYAAARWFHGPAEPRLPDFLALVEACSLRVLDFVACFADPLDLPEAAAPWRSVCAARKTAFELPWSHAVLRMLELEEYRKLPHHETGWLASRLGLTTSEERACLELLVEAGQARWNGSRYEPSEILVVDTRREPGAARALAVFWAEQGVSRLQRAADGHFAYNLFAVSNADYDRLRELQRAYFAQIRAIVAESAPAQRVALINLQMFPVAGGE